MKPLQWGILFCIFFAINIPAIMNDKGDSNAYVMLAKSLCRGTVSLSPGDMHDLKGTEIIDNGDLTFYQGKYYLPYPPAPALLIVPFLLIHPGFVNSVLICVLLGFLNIFLLYSILKKLSVGNENIPWLMYAFFFGTCYWSVMLTASHVYGFAEIVSETGILLLLNELFGKKRAFLLGLFLGMSFLSRQLTVILALFVVGYFIHLYLLSPQIQNKRLFLRKLGFFSLSLGISVCIYLIYNYIRFRNPLDTGYGNILFAGILKDRVDHYGVFSIHYVLYNLYSYLIKGFNIEFGGLGMLQIKDMDPFGTSLLMASPFVIAAFKTGWDKTLRYFAWITISIIFISMLFYHNNGKDQINASRFTLDFLPLLFVMVAAGAKNIPGWIFKGMVCYSIMLNIIALGIHGYYHSLAG
jgi:hypothetical protein